MRIKYNPDDSDGFDFEMPKTIGGWILFLAAAGITALTLVPQLGVMIHGSRRWIAIAGISFQPSEFLKIAFISFSAISVLTTF